MRRDPPRLADGRPGELRRDPLPDPARPGRHLLAARRGDGRRCRRRAAPGRRRRLRGGAAPGRGNDPHRGPRRRRSRSSGRWARARPRLVGVLERAAVAARDAVGRHPRPPARAARGRRRRRRRARVRAAPRRVPPRRGRHAPARRRGGALRRSRSTRTPVAARTRRHGDGRHRRPPLRGDVLPRGARRRASTASSAAWGDLGDSIVVVGGDGIWNCHVHTDDIGAAIEAGIAVGRPRDIRVTDLLEQVADREEEAWVRDGPERRRAPTPRPSTSPPASSRSRWATVSARCSAASACSRWSPVVSR